MLMLTFIGSKVPVMERLILGCCHVQAQVTGENISGVDYDCCVNVLVLRLHRSHPGVTCPWCTTPLGPSHTGKDSSLMLL